MFVVTIFFDIFVVVATMLFLLFLFSFCITVVVVVVVVVVIAAAVTFVRNADDSVFVFLVVDIVVAVKTLFTDVFAVGVAFFLLLLSFPINQSTNQTFVALSQSEISMKLKSLLRMLILPALGKLFSYKRAKRGSPTYNNLKLSILACT